MPSGVTQPIDRFFTNPAAVQLAPLELDDVFSDLVRDTNGVATMSLRGRGQQVDVALGANYRAVVIYAPKPAPGQDPEARNFVCIEPVAGIINALNLAHKGVYKDLQTSLPGVSGRRVSGSVRAVSRIPRIIVVMLSIALLRSSLTRNCPGRSRSTISRVRSRASGRATTVG